MRNFEAGIVCLGFGLIFAFFSIMFGLSSGDIGVAAVGFAYCFFVYLVFRFFTGGFRKTHRLVKEYEIEQAEKRRLEKEKMEQWKKEYPEEYLAQQRHIEEQKEEYRKVAEILKNNM